MPLGISKPTLWKNSPLIIDGTKNHNYSVWGQSASVNSWRNRPQSMQKQAMNEKQRKVLIESTRSND